MDRGWHPVVIDTLDILAEIALFRRQHERAVRLIAAADQQRSILGLVAFLPGQKRTERHLAAIGTALSDENIKKTFKEGKRLSLEEAVADAQQGRRKRAGATDGWASLSPVERQVVELASQGLSNPDIARGLFKSRNTVKVHLSHAYAKLGVANRTELARLAVRHSHDRHQR
jgi:DNA-binding NarL/FixJ family response regulator